MLRNAAALGATPTVRRPGRPSLRPSANVADRSRGVVFRVGRHTLGVSNAAVTSHGAERGSATAMAHAARLIMDR